MRLHIAFLATCLVAGVPAYASAQEPVTDIVKKMKEVFEPVRPSTRKVVISINAGNEKIQWVAGQARKELPDGKRMLMVMLAPESVIRYGVFDCRAER